MRVILFILAAYAFAAWNDARAECQRFKPDARLQTVALRRRLLGRHAGYPQSRPHAAGPCRTVGG